MRIEYCGDTAVLYSNGTCNLNCVYCNIDKNETLAKTDKILEESYKSDYYFDMLKKYYKRGQLKRIETWGGETFLHMERLYPLFHQVIDYFPYFSQIYTSTNFSYDAWPDKVMDTFKEFGKHPLRRFQYQLQLSIDGPEDMNDPGRGAGVTSKCLANYRRLMKKIKYEGLPDNVKVLIVLKPTWSLETLDRFKTKQDLIDYYKFFEEHFVAPIAELDKHNLVFGGGIPNMAAPSPATVEDGKKFAKICQMCLEIAQENAENPIFMVYKSIMPYSYVGAPKTDLTYKFNNNVCGIGNNSIGFLPGGKITICTEGFTEYAKNYRDIYNKDLSKDTKVIEQKQIKDNHISFSEEDWVKYADDWAPTCTWMSTARATMTAATLQIMAAQGQVDRKYLQEKEALLGAKLFQHFVPFCVKDNYAITGSRSLDPLGFYRLFFNGAIDCIAVEGMWVAENTEPFDTRK